MFRNWKSLGLLIAMTPVTACMTPPVGPVTMIEPLPAESDFSLPDVPSSSNAKPRRVLLALNVQDPSPAITGNTSKRRASERASQYAAALGEVLDEIGRRNNVTFERIASLEEATFPQKSAADYSLEVRISAKTTPSNSPAQVQNVTNPQRYGLPNGRSQTFGFLEGSLGFSGEFGYTIREPLTGEKLAEHSGNIGATEIPFQKAYKKMTVVTETNRTWTDREGNKVSLPDSTAVVFIPSESWGSGNEFNAYVAGLNFLFEHASRKAADTLTAALFDSLDPYLKDIRERKRY